MSFCKPPSANVNASFPVLNAELCSGTPDSLSYGCKGKGSGFAGTGWKIILVISGRSRGGGILCCTVNSSHLL